MKTRGYSKCNLGSTTSQLFNFYNFSNWPLRTQNDPRMTKKDMKQPKRHFWFLEIKNNHQFIHFSLGMLLLVCYWIQKNVFLDFWFLQYSYDSRPFWHEKWVSIFWIQNGLVSYRNQNALLWVFLAVFDHFLSFCKRSGQLSAVMKIEAFRVERWLSQFCS